MARPRTPWEASISPQGVLTPDKPGRPFSRPIGVWAYEYRTPLWAVVPAAVFSAFALWAAGLCSACAVPWLAYVFAGTVAIVVTGLALTLYLQGADPDRGRSFFPFVCPGLARPLALQVARAAVQAAGFPGAPTKSDWIWELVPGRLGVYVQAVYPQLQAGKVLADTWVVVYGRGRENLDAYLKLKGHVAALAQAAGAVIG